jgi:hypothetical protein
MGEGEIATLSQAGIELRCQRIVDGSRKESASNPGNVNSSLPFYFTRFLVVNTHRPHHSRRRCRESRNKPPLHADLSRETLRPRRSCSMIAVSKVCRSLGNFSRTLPPSCAADVRSGQPGYPAGFPAPWRCALHCHFALVPATHHPVEAAFDALIINRDELSPMINLLSISVTENQQLASSFCARS